MKSNRLTPEEVAELEGDAFLRLGAPEDCRAWHYDPAYPVAAVAPAIREWFFAGQEENVALDWRKWWDGEVAAYPGWEEFEQAWIADPSAFPPVVLAELGGGRVDIGDGWHRIAMAVLHGPDRVHAFVGRDCREERRR